MKLLELLGFKVKSTTKQVPITNSTITSSPIIEEDTIYKQLGVLSPSELAYLLKTFKKHSDDVNTASNRVKDLEIMIDRMNNTDTLSEEEKILLEALGTFNGGVDKYKEKCEKELAYLKEHIYFIPKITDKLKNFEGIIDD